MIAVIDYGVGNLFSLCRSLEAIGQEPVVTGDPALLQQADKLFLPGVALSHLTRPPRPEFPPPR